MKEIASLANVSIATVSYVLNNVNNQTIPDSTRSEILRIAKEHHYVPNLAARSLTNKKTGLIGILVNRPPHMPYWKRENYHSFIDGLERLLTDAGYHTILLSLNANNPSLEVITARTLEAVFLVDVREEVFYSISTHFVKGVPLILIDSMIEDQLFKHIYYDYASALTLAAPTDLSNVCLIMENFNNSLLVHHILDVLNLPKDAIFILNTTSDLDSIPRDTPYTTAIVINEFIGNAVERLDIFSNISVICTCHCPEILSSTTKKITFQEDKSVTAFQLMLELLHKHEYNHHDRNTYEIKVK